MNLLFTVVKTILGLVNLISGNTLSRVVLGNPYANWGHISIKC